MKTVLGNDKKVFFKYIITPIIIYCVGLIIFAVWNLDTNKQDVLLSIFLGLFFFLLSIPLITGLILYLQKQTIALKEANLQLKDEMLKREIAIREAMKASMAKHDFLANISHEFKTPLNAIMGFSRILEKEDLGELNDKQKSVLNCIHESGSQLLNMINDVLNLAKIEANDMPLDLVDIDVRSEIEYNISIVRRMIEGRKINISTAIFDCESRILVDEIKFRQIIYNLLTNAVKFTPENGSIRIEARKKIMVGENQLSKSILKITVEDTGIGIANEDLKRIFQPFEQIDKTDSRHVDGFGLGLILVKRLVELHEGEVTVKSRVGEGSCFSIVLPYKTCNQST